MKTTADSRLFHKENGANNYPKFASKVFGNSSIILDFTGE